MDKQGSRQQQRPIKRAAQLRQIAHPQHQQQGGELQQADDQFVIAAEQNGGGFHTNLQIIVAIDHGIQRIVSHRPADIGQQQQPAAQRQRFADGGVGHRNAPTKRGAQYELRQMSDPLHKRIGPCQRQRRQRQPDGHRIQRQHQRERNQHQHHKQDLGLFFAHPAAGHWASGGTLHMAIDGAIGIIIHHTAGGTHQENPDHEHQQDRQRRHALPRQPQCPQRRPQQQQGANRFIDAHQMAISLPFTLNHASLQGISSPHHSGSVLPAAYSGEAGRNSSVSNSGLPASRRRERRAHSASCRPIWM